MKRILEVIAAGIFLIGIQAWFIGLITAAAWLFAQLPLPPMLQYPLGSVVVAFSIWGAVISSKLISAPLIRRLGG